MSQNNNIETAGKWPCPKDAENIPLKTIAMIMNAFNITVEQYMDNRLHWLEESRKRGYIS